MMPRTITLTTAALCCFAFCSVSLGAQPEAGEVVCPKAVSTISIDGKADEAAWKQAATVGPFVTIATLVIRGQYI